jgi:hypothetical protein
MESVFLASLDSTPCFLPFISRFAPFGRYRSQPFPACD